MLTILGLINALSPVLPTLIKGVDKLFGNHTGPTKLAIVTSAARTVTDAMAAAGRLPGLPDDAMLKTVVETMVASLNATGDLQGAATNTLPPPAPDLAIAQKMTETAIDLIGAATKLLYAISPAH